MQRLGLFVTVAALLVLTCGTALAQGNSDRFYASSERFGYTGVVSVYDTWSDAHSGLNARCSTVLWPQRDGAVYVVRNVPDYDADYNVLMTNWFANNGGSPSNKNEGFFQIYDDNADAWQNQKASWSKDLNTFTLQAKGRNATYGSDDPLDYARLWNACAPAGSGESTKGTFLTYEYVFIATGLKGAKAADGLIKNTQNATNYAGYFRGIFLNQSASSPASNGYYVFDLQFNNTSWAVQNNCGYNGGAKQTPPCTGNPPLPDEFGAKK